MASPEGNRRGSASPQDRVAGGIAVESASRAWNSPQRARHIGSPGPRRGNAERGFAVRTARTNLFLLCVALGIATGEARAFEVLIDLGLAGATVEVRDLASLEGPPLFATQSSGGALAVAGRFEIPDVLVGPDGVFVVSARGGHALDADGDDLPDAVATPNGGVLHAILTSAQIQRGTARVSIATEVLFQRVRYHLAADFPADSIVESLHARAAAMLAADVDGDGDQDADDVAVIDSDTDLAALQQSADYTALTADLLAGASPDRTSVLAKTEPHAPSAIGTPASPGATGAAASTVAGDLVLATKDAGASVFLHDPTATPVLVHQSTLAVLGTAIDVAARGSVALVLSTGGLASFDLATPSAPQPIDTLALSVSVVGQMALVGDVVYVGTGSALRVVEVSPAGMPH